MVLIDSSCWIDFLRDADTPATTYIDRVVAHDLSSVVTCEPIVMELLAGPTGPDQLNRLENLVNGLPCLPFEPTVDFRTAASIQRAVRTTGRTVRSMIDCLIAAVALRHDVEVAHKDADFDLIAGVTKLKVRALH